MTCSCATWLDYHCYCECRWDLFFQTVVHLFMWIMSHAIIVLSSWMYCFAVHIDILDNQILAAKSMTYPISPPLHSGALILAIFSFGSNFLTLYFVNCIIWTSSILQILSVVIFFFIFSPLLRSLISDFIQVSRANSLQHLNIGGTFITDESLYAVARSCPHIKVFS